MGASSFSPSSAIEFGVQIGDIHSKTWTKAWCKEHSYQMISCVKSGYHTLANFTGEFRGSSEMMTRSLFAKFGDKKGWISCEREVIKAKTNLNRVEAALTLQLLNEKLQ